MQAGLSAKRYSMARKGARYTAIGAKLAQLAVNQSELAQVLRLTQQSVSGKLTGKIAVTLKDLELLAAHYDVPLIYFVAADPVTPELARAWEKILDGPPELHHTIEIASKFPLPFARQLLKIVQAMRSTSSYYAEHWQRDALPGSLASSAAEADEQYPQSK